jgi:hypothetical protein
MERQVMIFARVERWLTVGLFREMSVSRRAVGEHGLRRCWLRDRIFMLRSRAIDTELSWLQRVAKWELLACHPFHNEHGF